MKTELMPIVDCRGGPRQRGRAHGEALRSVIADKIERWYEAIGQAYAMPAGMFIESLLAETAFERAIDRHAADLAEEVDGLAEGAGIDIATARAMQLMDEEWWFGKRDGPGHCSSVAVAPAAGHGSIAGQTMDLPRWHDGAQAVLLFSGPDGSRSAVFTSAGMIGLMGTASGGLAVCVNTLSQLTVRLDGLPVAYVMRKALAAGSVATAASVLRDVPHASGQNYQLADATGIATIECSAGGAVDIDVGAGLSLHTNHPLASRDLRSDRGDFTADSAARLASLQADLKGRPGIAEVRTALAACRADGPVSIARKPNSSGLEPMTVGAITSEIGDDVTVCVCAGPPSQQEWRHVSL